jgi:hypothetical protein
MRSILTFVIACHLLRTVPPQQLAKLDICVACRAAWLLINNTKAKKEERRN